MVEPLLSPFFLIGGLVVFSALSVLIIFWMFSLRNRSLRRSRAVKCGGSTSEE